MVGGVGGQAHFGAAGLHSLGQCSHKRALSPLHPASVAPPGVAQHGTGGDVSVPGLECG